MSERPRMLADHRRALAWSLVLLAACVASLFFVGRHRPEVAPHTTVPFVGRFDAAIYRRIDDVRRTPLTWICRGLNVIGSGIVTIPLRSAVTLYLAIRRRWLRAIAFACTWAVSELVLTWLKAYLHRGRPPNPLVLVSGYSFPSGHAVAGAATAVALVLALLPTGERRRVWEWVAVAFASVMALSRVYLAAHWFSDVVAGTLLGAGIAIFVAASATEIRDLVFARARVPIPPDEELPAVGPTGQGRSEP